MKALTAGNDFTSRVFLHGLLDGFGRTVTAGQDMAATEAVHSEFRKLPKTMPWRAKAQAMVDRGEAKDFSTACSLLARRKHGTTMVAPTDRMGFCNIELPKKQYWWQS